MQLDFPYSHSRRSVLRHGAVLVDDSPAIFSVEGSGALTCLQGLLTCDLDAAGDWSLSWGALLSPKGMILFDAWVMREGERFTIIAEAVARTAARELFRRTLPPRLAKMTDLTETHRVGWLLGRCSALGLASLPEPARVVRIGAGGMTMLAAGTPTAPFAFLVAAPMSAAPEFADGLKGGQVERGTMEDLAAERIQAGWPTLGREIDEKTLPQEVRFDELGGVSYTKGCYTGQETVARVHFRGHVNRTLRGVVVDRGDPIEDRVIRMGGKDVGSVRTAMHLQDKCLALASIRREVEVGASLEASGREVRVMELPFAETEPALHG